MRARIDISEVEVGTKIRAKYLRALENEEWDLLPGPVYVKSFLKTYGDYLGLDSRLLVDEFKRRYERPSDHDVRAMATTARERDRRAGARQPSRVGSALLSPRTAIGVALVAIVVAIYVIGTQNNKPTTAGTPAPATKGSGHHHRHPRGTSTGAGTTTTQANTVTTNTVTTPVNASLKLAATSTVWICVENQAGKPLMAARDYSAGETIPTLHARQMLLTLGNTGVTMTVDGKSYTPTVPTGSAVVALKITPTGASRLGTPPTCGQ